MTSLAIEQQALLGALFTRPLVGQSDTATNLIATHAYYTGARGLKAYINNGFSLAERTLLAAYPVMAQLLGADSFTLLARDFWLAHPPVRGDLAHWGAALGDFVQHNALLADEPYLGDVARVEWALHRSASAADRDAQPATFALLSTVEPDALTLQLASCVFVLASAYPVVSIITAHLGGGPTLEAVGSKLRASERECALVWRQGFKPQVASCTVAQAGFMQALLSGASLLSALERADEFDFNQWLPAAVQSGLVLGVRSIDPISTSI
jgi:Putative DNA-binding domain